MSDVIPAPIRNRDYGSRLRVSADGTIVVDKSPRTLPADSQYHILEALRHNTRVLGRERSFPSSLGMYIQGFISYVKRRIYR